VVEWFTTVSMQRLGSTNLFVVKSKDLPVDTATAGVVAMVMYHYPTLVL
jgi:hypothetical protein